MRLDVLGCAWEMFEMKGTRFQLGQVVLRYRDLRGPKRGLARQRPAVCTS